jgi:hypothetical protein
MEAAMTTPRETCPKCGAKYSLRVSGVRYECDSVMFSGGQFFQSKTCKGLIRITELEKENERLRGELNEGCRMIDNLTCKVELWKSRASTLLDKGGKTE